LYEFWFKNKQKHCSSFKIGLSSRRIGQSTMTSSSFVSNEMNSTYIKGVYVKHCLQISHITGKGRESSNTLKKIQKHWIDLPLFSWSCFVIYPMVQYRLMKKNQIKKRYSLSPLLWKNIFSIEEPEIRQFLVFAQHSGILVKKKISQILNYYRILKILCNIFHIELISLLEEENAHLPRKKIYIPKPTPLPNSKGPFSHHLLIQLINMYNKIKNKKKDVGLPFLFASEIFHTPHKICPL